MILGTQRKEIVYCCGLWLKPEEWVIEILPQAGFKLPLSSSLTPKVIVNISNTLYSKKHERQFSVDYNNLAWVWQMSDKSESWLSFLHLVLPVLLPLFFSPCPPTTTWRIVTILLGSDKCQTNYRVGWVFCTSILRSSCTSSSLLLSVPSHHHFKDYIPNRI